jgi:hypothetical protein
MQANSLSKIALILGGILVALFCVVEVLSSSGNAVAQLFRYALVGGALYGLFNPRPAFYLLIAFTAYLDFLKRMMVFDSGATRFDLYYVLGLSPALLLGIAFSLIYHQLTSRLAERKGILKLCFVTLFITVVLAGAGLSTSTNRLQGVGDTVNATIYILLIPVVTIMFRTPEELRGMLKKVLLIYVPAVLYMLAHWFRSIVLDMNPPIFDWELDYVKSGMTIEIRQLSEVRFRPFGTFNSAANASIIFAAVSGLTLSGLWTKLAVGRSSGGRFWRGVFVVLLFVAMYATFSRTGWIFALLVPFVAVAFRRRVSTLVLYVFGMVSVAALLASSGYLLKHKILYKFSTDMIASAGGSDNVRQTANIATMDDRLEGYSELFSNSKMWTPLGFRFSYFGASSPNISVHDALGDALMKYGYVPLTVGGGVALLLLYRMHKYVWSEPLPLARHMAASCLGVGAVLSLGAFVTSAQFLTYPVNFWIWFMFSCVVSLMFWRRENPVVAEVSVTSSDSQLHRRPVRMDRTGGRVGESMLARRGGRFV